MTFDANFAFAVHHCGQPDPGITETFLGLPEDLYTKEAYRYRFRRYARASFVAGKPMWCRNSSYLQSSALNPYLGDVLRKYQDIEPVVIEFLEEQLLPLIGSRYGLLTGDANADLHVHQYRVTATTWEPGHPAPEGIHRDGYDYQALFCVNVENAAGGVTTLIDACSDTVVFQSSLKPGELMLFDDRKFRHYTSPIVPLLPGNAYRDVIIITWTTLVL